VRRRRKAAFAVAAVVGILGLAEVGLRLTGFTYQPIPERIWLGRLDGGIPTAEVVFDRLVPGLFTRDALLFWRPVAGQPPFNAAGLRDDEELPPSKPPGEMRILALGDSCTFLGEPLPWTDVLEQRLRPLDGPRVRVLNAAVPAWSSLQGLRYLESRGLSFEPDLVAIYFGWNDHWRATSKPDADFPVPDERLVSTQRVLSRLRLYQLLNYWLKGGWRRPPGAGERAPFAAGEDLAATAVGRQFRVPLEQFEENLRRMAELARGIGARPLFITAPSRLRAEAVPEYLLAHGFVARGGERIDAVHERYAAAVRRVARETGALLVDAAADFAAAPDGGRERLRDDGIHLTAAGIERLATLVSETLEAAGLPGGAD
jgi:lysophospholipase L1-like esterase